MKLKSINFKLLLVMTTAFVFAAGGIIVSANYQIHRIIDKSQEEIYKEKLDNAIRVINRNYSMGQESLDVGAYENQFKINAIKALQNIHYDGYHAGGADVYPFIFNKKGVVVMHPVHEKGKDISSIGVIPRVIAQKNGELHYNYNGKEKWIVFRYFPQWDWFVGYSLPLEFKYADSKAIIRGLILIVFMIATVAVVLAAIVITKFMHPIRELTIASAEIAKGNLDYEINVTQNDEVGVLAKSFIAMKDAVKEKLKYIEYQNEKLVETLGKLEEEVGERKKFESSLAAINEDLDNKVKERTAQLEEMVDKLDASNKQLEQFCYIASHDLREPLRKISSFGSLLERSLQDSLDEDDRENMDFMIDGADRMAEMIDGLLAYSRVSTKGRSAEVVDLNEAVKGIQQLELAVLLEEKNVKVEVQESLGLIEIDPAQIRQLLQNLIANGVKYQKEGSRPTIKISSETLDDGMIRVEIQDNGIGIKPEYQGCIFDMFKRLHSRNDYDGTGIGLSVCKKIVERHGGKIGLESEYGEGTTFWFTVPAAGKACEVVEG